MTAPGTNKFQPRLPTSDRVLDRFMHDVSEWLNNLPGVGLVWGGKKNKQINPNWCADTPAAVGGTPGPGSANTVSRCDHVHDSTHNGIRLSFSADQTISHATDTALTWDVEDFKNGVLHAAGSADVTIREAGRYLIYAQARWDKTPAVAYDSKIKIAVNGIVVAENWLVGTASRYLGVQISDLRNLHIDDTAQIQIFQNTGGNVKVLSGPAETWCYLCKEGFA